MGKQQTAGLLFADEMRILFFEICKKLRNEKNDGLIYLFLRNLLLDHSFSLSIFKAQRRCPYLSLVCTFLLTFIRSEYTLNSPLIATSLSFSPLNNNEQ